MSQGAEHAVNAMRSALLLALDEFEGLVIFATNLVEAYDQAFDSRTRHIHFPPPLAKARRRAAGNAETTALRRAAPCW